METLRAPLANFRQSHFAPILSEAKAESTLDLDEALAGGVTDISLPATAASEDVPLMGRILLQDLKQAVGRREQRLGGFTQHLPTTMSMAVIGIRMRNTLVVIDEFAWPPEADWPVPAARWSATPTAMAAPAVEEVPYDDLPCLPEPPGLDPA